MEIHVTIATFIDTYVLNIFFILYALVHEYQYIFYRNSSPISIKYMLILMDIFTYIINMSFSDIHMYMHEHI